MMKVTWVKLLGEEEVIWVGIRGDMIVDSHPALVGKRADDTLSEMARLGWRLEGPFDEPE